MPLHVVLHSRILPPSGIGTDFKPSATTLMERTKLLKSQPRLTQVEVGKTSSGRTRMFLTNYLCYIVLL